MRIESLRDLLGQFPDIDGFWHYDDVFKTEFHITGLLPVEDESWSPEKIEALTQLARAQGLSGRLPQSRIALDKAKSLIDRLDESQKGRPMIRYLLELGRIFSLSMTPMKALPCFQQAWSLALDKHEVFFAIDAALMLSISQPPKYQNEWLQKALSLAEENKNDQGKLWLGHLYMMDGWHKFDFRQFDGALESFQKALDQPRVPGDESKITVIRWCVARALRSVRRFQESLDIQMSLMKEFAEKGTTNGHVALEIGECYQALQDHEEARTYFASAYKDLSENSWYKDNKATELVRIQFLSKRR